MRLEMDLQRRPAPAASEPGVSPEEAEMLLEAEAPGVSGLAALEPLSGPLPLAEGGEMLEPLAVPMPAPPMEGAGEEKEGKTEAQAVPARKAGPAAPIQTRGESFWCFGADVPQPRSLGTRASH